MNFHMLVFGRLKTENDRVMFNLEGEEMKTTLKNKNKFKSNILFYAPSFVAMFIFSINFYVEREKMWMSLCLILSFLCLIQTYRYYKSYLFNKE